MKRFIAVIAGFLAGLVLGRPKDKDKTKFITQKQWDATHRNPYDLSKRSWLRK
jgi:hypothetical protein